MGLLHEISVLFKLSLIVAQQNVEKLKMCKYFCKTFMSYVAIHTKTIHPLLRNDLKFTKTREKKTFLFLGVYELKCPPLSCFQSRCLPNLCVFSKTACSRTENTVSIVFGPHWSPITGSPF